MDFQLNEDQLMLQSMVRLEILGGMGAHMESSIPRYLIGHFCSLHGAGTPVLNRIRAMKLGL